MISLIILTLILNIVCFALNIFNLYFGTAFSRRNFEMFKNPAEGFVGGLTKEILKELITYYRIILFVPFFVLLIFFINLDKSLYVDYIFYENPWFVITMLISSLLVISFTGFQVNIMFRKTISIKAVQSTFAIQNYGIYPFYLFNFLGFPRKYRLPNKKYYNEFYLFDLFRKYNKNLDKYNNVFSSKEYSNRLDTNQLAKNIYIDPSLIETDNSLNGILKGKNLVLFQVESMNQFLFEIDLLKTEFPFIRSLMKESLVLENFYSSVGLGVSSDAEATTLTGLYPTGYDILYWKDFNMKSKEFQVKREFTTLPKFFKEKGYFTEGIHGDQKIFYNRENAYREVIGLDNYHALESFVLNKIESKNKNQRLYEYEYLPNQKHICPWASDYLLADLVRERVNNYQKKQMLFPITMLPHVPFEFYPREKKQHIESQNLKKLTKRYLSFSDYYDDIIKRVFLDQNNKNKIDSNTVYIFYGDHGAGIKNGDVSKLYNKKLDKLEEKRLGYQVAAFMYVPGKRIIDIDGYSINEGLIKGVQSKVRGQMDLYRSIIELFDLNDKSAYFGAHILSDEDNFVIDNQLQYIISDIGIFSMRNIDKKYPRNLEINKELYRYIRDFKILNDFLMESPSLLSKMNKNNINL